ncbi:MAG: TetR family transcriptional regulator [Marmoricola sp.]|nr:TetR family transcriptional regulator [Marmoricola sp.]
MSRSADPEQRWNATTNRILAAAGVILAEEGIGRFTLALVGRQAGLSRATVYNHFSSRDELVLRLVQDAMDRVAPSAAGDTNHDRGAATAQAMVTAFAETIGSPAASMSALTAPDRALQHLQVAIADEMSERFRSALDVDRPEIVATALMWATVGLLLLAGQGQVDVSALPTRIASMTEVVLAGLPQKRREQGAH